MDEWEVVRCACEEAKALRERAARTRGEALALAGKLRRSMDSRQRLIFESFRIQREPSLAQRRNRGRI